MAFRIKECMDGELQIRRASDRNREPRVLLGFGRHLKAAAGKMDAQTRRGLNVEGRGGTFDSNLAELREGAKPG
jgi:hypothetical protein